MTHEPVHEMFRRAAERHADRTAIEWTGGRVSYRRLAARADELTAWLLEAGAQKGSLVGILTARSAEVVASILGILQAGCAFVPFDPEFPTARLDAVPEEVRPRFWLTTAGLADRLAPLRGDGEAAVLRLDDDGWLDAGEPAPRPPAVALDPDALSYVYFTSGSTGRPKAIGGRLKAIDHFVRWEVEAFGLGERTRVSQLISPGFDAFLRDVFVPLSVGGTVCVPADRETLLDGSRLVEWIDSEAINLVHCTPSLFRSLLNQDLKPSRFAALSHVLLAGEPLLPSDVRRWCDVFADRIQLVNLYGPSETTMVKFFYLVKPEDGHGQVVPIGRPVPGARAIVVDDRGQPCPPGKLGEIYIRTQYRSHGYLGQPELTAQTFIQNPWSDQPGDIVYKTGDLGRLREDGDFEFIGRRDQQVKIRGVRIELTPIEDQLRTHPAIAEAAVVDRDDSQGNKLLCAYVVLKHPVDTAELADHLRASLPEPMVPSVFVPLESLPRTLSGKVDRRALPNPGQRLGREYVGPRTPVEERLCAIFSELLSISEVSICDNFFEIGGHSLLATLLLSRIRAAFGVEASLRDIFRTPTVEGLALAVTRLQVEQEDGEEIAALIREIRDLPESILEDALRREAGASAEGGTSLD